MPPCQEGADEHGWSLAGHHVIEGTSTTCCVGDILTCVADLFPMMLIDASSCRSYDNHVPFPAIVCNHLRMARCKFVRSITLSIHQ